MIRLTKTLSPRWPVLIQSTVIGMAMICAGAVFGAQEIRLKPIADGLTSPLSLVPLPDGQSLIVDQVGLVHVLNKEMELQSAPALVWTNRLIALKLGGFDERGLLDLQLHPKFAENRRVYISYNAPKRDQAPEDWDNTLRVSELRLPKGDIPQMDPESEKVILEVDQPFFNHNGGRMAFGPDGFLYVAIGDGGSANDTGKRGPHGNGQDTSNLLGSIIRVDIDSAQAGKAYAIPSDNPFADGVHGRPEIYAYGLRNVWGLSFDRGGDRALYAADVGQNLFEELNIIVNGGNYGWFFREGFEAFNSSTPNEPPADGRTTGLRGEPFIDPIAVYRHPTPRRQPGEHGISVTGGYIYRGKAFPDLVGHYVYGDWSRHWALPQGQFLVAKRPDEAGKTWTVEALKVAEPTSWKGYITGFGQGTDGELYVLTNDTNGLTPGNGKIWKLVP